MLGVACQKLVDIDNGRVINEDVVPRYGSNVTFTCDEGYQLTGSSTRTCLHNGTWSGPASTCERTSLQPNRLVLALVLVVLIVLVLLVVLSLLFLFLFLFFVMMMMMMMMKLKSTYKC